MTLTNPRNARLAVSTAAWLLVVGIAFAAASCGGSPDPLSERKRRAEAEAAQSGDVEPGGAAAGDEAADTVMDDLEADEPAPAPEPKTAKKSRKGKQASSKRTSRDEDAVAADDEEPAPGSDGGAMDELRKEVSVRRQEARFHAERGEALFKDNRYEEAAQALETAVTLDPSLEQAQARLHETKLILGHRQGSVQTIIGELSAEKDVARQQRTLQIERNMADAEAALKAEDMERAEHLAKAAVDDLALELDHDPALKARANALLGRVRVEKQAREDRQRSTLIRRTEEEARLDLERQKQVAHNSVQELLRKTSELLRQEEYEKAVEACERVLTIDPENRVAKFWMADAKDQLLRLRRARLVQHRADAVRETNEGFEEARNPQAEPFRFPGDWARVQERARALSTLSLEDPEDVQAIKRALQVVVSFDFDKTPLADVVQQLRTVTGARISVDPGVNQQELTVTGSYQGLPAHNVLNLVLETVGLSYVYKEQVLFITGAGQKSANTEFVTYNVTDLLNKIRDFEGPALILRSSSESGAAPISFTTAEDTEESQLDPEKLEQLIKESTGGEEVWADPNTIEFHGGQFFVTAPREMHQQIETVLANLRKDADLFVVIEARFIDVNDDFLEDIGVDYRALGLGSNYGTPYGNVINDARTGGQDLGFVKQGSPVRDVTLIMGQDRWAGRVRHIIDGFAGTIRGERLTAGGGVDGITAQLTWLEPFQINTIVRAVQERGQVRQLTAPVITAHNGQRVFVSVITQRAYIADYNLVSGGTGFAIIEVADPEVQTFQEGVILDVDPVISHDKKYVTLDVRPTLATLIGGVISTILISLGSFTNVAFMVPIGVPEISLQQSFTSVTVPNGGTVLLGGFKSLNDQKFLSYIPILGKIPIINNLFRRQAQLIEKRSLVILLSARIVDLRTNEARTYNAE
jgi:general secretion pathway protein D